MIEIQLLALKGNILLCSLGYQSNPLSVLLQEEWLRTEGEGGGDLTQLHLETGYFHRKEVAPIGGQPIGALCLLVGVVDWCVSWLLRLICCQIILTASSPGSLLPSPGHLS